MKILMVTPGRLPVPASRGGAVETLIEMLLDYNEKYTKDEIHVLSVTDKIAIEMSKKYQNSTFHFINLGKMLEIMVANHFLPYRLIDFFYSKKCIRLLRNKQICFDRIIIQNELVNGLVFQKFLPGTYIYHAHNDTLKKEKRWESDFLRSCEKVISISDFLGKQLQEKANLKKLCTVYNGIDTDLFQRQSHQKKGKCLREKYGIMDDEIVVVFAGRITSEKGIKELLKAFLLIPSEKKITLLILGGSFFEDSKENIFIKELKEIGKAKKEKIIFSGYVKHEEMPHYYSMADIGCIPSVWDEPFGLVVVEQMAMELPIITTDSGAIPEIVDETCAVIVKRNERLCENLAEAILELSECEEKRKKIGQAGRQIVEKSFAQDLFCKKWFEEIR